MHQSIGVTLQLFQMYDLGKTIHKGFASVVQEAKDYIGKEFAIKRIDLDKFENADSIANVRNEICLMFFHQHPNLVKYYHSFAHDHEIWIVMEKYDCSLASLVRPIKDENDIIIREAGIKDPGFVATVLHQVLTGLDFLHEKGTMHRDIKGANVLLKSDGTVCLADFGVSRANFEKGPHSFCGTPCWMAPELFDQEYDKNADIWSFGIMILEILFGRPPYARFAPFKVMKLILSNPPPIPDKSDVKNVNLLNLIIQCLTKDPEKRPGTTKLLSHKFFKNNKQSCEYLTPFINQYLGIPPPKELHRKAATLKERLLNLVSNK